MATSIFLMHPEIFNQTLLLPEENINCAYETIRSWASFYKLNETKHMLQLWLIALLTCDDEAFEEPSDRANLVEQIRHLQEVFEAVYILDKYRSYNPEA